MAPFFRYSTTVRPVPTSLRKALRSNGRIIAGVTALVAITAYYEGRSRQSTPRLFHWRARTRLAKRSASSRRTRRTGAPAERYVILSAGGFALLPPNRALIIIL